MKAVLKPKFLLSRNTAFIEPEVLQAGASQALKELSRA
jgi:hypothetical protein